MKYYQVTFVDEYDAGCHGVINGFYTSKEEAEKAAAWYRKHPDPYMNYRIAIQEIDLSDIREQFVPPISEEEYDRQINEAYAHVQEDIYYEKYQEDDVEF